MFTPALFYSLSIPRILRANCISLGIIVTLFPCIAHKLLSSNNATKCASAASCNANIALPCHRYGCRVIPYCISRTNLANGNRRKSSDVDDWYCRISRNARSPGRDRRLRRTMGRAVVGPRGRLLPLLDERRPSDSSRGRARPNRGSLRDRLALAGGFARAILLFCGD